MERKKNLNVMIPIGINRSKRVKVIYSDKTAMFMYKKSTNCSSPISSIYFTTFRPHIRGIKFTDAPTCQEHSNYHPNTLTHGYSEKDGSRWINIHRVCTTDNVLRIKNHYYNYNLVVNGEEGKFKRNLLRNVNATVIRIKTW